jgi:hypothetical protein
VIVVVPLAGPDFEAADGTVKAEIALDSLPLLRHALESRAWWGAGVGQLIFVLKDSPRSRRFAAESLAAWYPKADVTYISAYTGGAALSAAAGLALARDLDAPVIIDLADILFEGGGEAPALFADAKVGGAALTFPADAAKYSYLRLDADGRMIEAREKVVISSHASAGVYLFRNAGVYFAALAHSLANREALAPKGLVFVCPTLNGVVAQGLEVRAVAVTGVVDIKP